jgi:CheY-like chemotaxis protein
VVAHDPWLRLQLHDFALASDQPVMIATNGASALRQLDGTQSAIFIHPRLPEMGGAELLHEIRALTHRTEIAIVVVQQANEMLDPEVEALADEVLRLTRNGVQFGRAPQPALPAPAEPVMVGAGVTEGELVLA